MEGTHPLGNIMKALLLLVVSLALTGASLMPPSLQRLRMMRSALLAEENLCQGKQTTCADSMTLRICADLGAGFVPVSTMACPATGTPYCEDGRCVAEPPPTTTPAPTPKTTSRPTVGPYPGPDGDDICDGRLSFCADCYTQTLCARLGKNVVPVLNSTCPATSPYCVEGACQADLAADSECEPVPVPESKFHCYGGGYFPDPANCSVYHLCVSGKAYDYECPQGLVYEHERALCVPGRNKCFEFDCVGRANRYVLYTPYQSLYALCVTESKRDALVASCPAGHRLNSADNKDVRCEPYCSSVGRFADANDSTGTAYYECLASAGPSEFIGPLRAACPGGSTFDAASQRCRETDVAPYSSTVVVEPTTVPSDVDQPTTAATVSAQPTTTVGPVKQK